MTIIPWRVKRFLSDRFPLLYHLTVNLGTKGNDAGHWDRRLELSWDDPRRRWPAKNDLIASLTKRDDAVLDVGCGNGSILRALRGRGYSQLHGLEISDYAIRRLRAEGISMHSGTLPDIALPDASFDVVIASQVLEHVIRRGRFLSEMRRVLRPGGSAFIFVPDDCMGPIDEPEHVVKFNAGSLSRLLARYFQVARLESIREANFALPFLFAHVRKSVK